MSARTKSHARSHKKVVATLSPAQGLSLMVAQKSQRVRARRKVAVAPAKPLVVMDESTQTPSVKKPVIATSDTVYKQTSPQSYEYYHRVLLYDRCTSCEHLPAHAHTLVTLLSVLLLMISAMIIASSLSFVGATSLSLSESVEIPVVNAAEVVSE